jgi:hypothetical protein
MALGVLQHGWFAGSTDDEINDGTGGVERGAELTAVN